MDLLRFTDDRPVDPDRHTGRPAARDGLVGRSLVVLGGS
jgi:hypothetical protein